MLVRIGKPNICRGISERKTSVNALLVSNRVSLVLPSNFGTRWGYLRNHIFIEISL